MVRTARNVAIVVALAAAVWAVPGGGRAANLIGSVLAVLFALGLGLFGGRLYLEHRLTIYGLGDRLRGTLYGALAVAFLTLAATTRLWASSAGTLVWGMLLGAVAYVLIVAYRATRLY